MVRGGYGINFDRCCVCGRPYKGEGRAAYKQEKGGIVCLKCEQESAVSPGVNPETVKMIKRIQSGPLTTLKELKLTDEMIREIKPVLQRHKDYHLGQRLKTAAYLE
jgi:DNA repair protein RecO (recombination protein O)